MKPVIIAVAPTGSVPRKKDNPAVPVTPAEQVESTHEAFEAGASLMRVHVRNPDESASSNAELVRLVAEAAGRHGRCSATPAGTRMASSLGSAT